MDLGKRELHRPLSADATGFEGIGMSHASNHKVGLERLNPLKLIVVIGFFNNCR